MFCTGALLLASAHDNIPDDLLLHNTTVAATTPLSQPASPESSQQLPQQQLSPVHTHLTRLGSRTPTQPLPAQHAQRPVHPSVQLAQQASQELGPRHSLARLSNMPARKLSRLSPQRSMELQPQQPPMGRAGSTALARQSSVMPRASMTGRRVQCKPLDMSVSSDVAEIVSPFKPGPEGKPGGK